MLLELLEEQTLGAMLTGNIPDKLIATEEFLRNIKEFGTDNRSEAEHYAEAIRLFRLVVTRYMEMIDDLFVDAGFLPVDPDRTTIPDGIETE